MLTAKKIDFFRLEPGSKYKPAVGDNIVLAKMGIEDFKAFGDPKEEDALLWARWGGSSFEQNQSRQYTVNPYDEAYEKTVRSASSVQEGISLKDFLHIVADNFPEKSTRSDIEGYLNRYHMVLLTDSWIYYRFATDSTDDNATVPRMAWPNPAKHDLFRPEAMKILQAFKKDQTFLPDGYAQTFDWDVALLQMLAEGQKPAQTTTLVSPCLFGGPAQTTYTHPRLERERGSNSASDAPPAASAKSEEHVAFAHDADFDEDPMGFRDHGGEVNHAAPQPVERSLTEAASSSDFERKVPDVISAGASTSRMSQAREALVKVKRERQVKLQKIKSECNGGVWAQRLHCGNSSQRVDLDADSPEPSCAKVAKLEPEALEQMRAVQAAFAAAVVEMKANEGDVPIVIDDE